GAPRTVLAALAAHDAYGQAQYFEAKLPALYVGDTVEYRVVGRAPGHQIPAEAGQYPSLFQVMGTAGSRAGTALPLPMGGPAPSESGAAVARRPQLPSPIMARAAAPGSITPLMARAVAPGSITPPAGSSGGMPALPAHVVAGPAGAQAGGIGS